MDEYTDLCYKDSKYNQRQYYKNHCKCPKCGKVNGFTQTCVGYIMLEPELFSDRNQVWCNCEFEGIVHDLLPKD